MIHDDLDMLECRLTELDNVVDRFIAVEANITHQAKPKPYYLSENFDRFKAWHDKLIVVRTDKLPGRNDTVDPWIREKAQREFIFEGLTDIPLNAMIMHGDIDEIPSRNAVYKAREMITNNTYVAFNQTLYCFAVDWLHPDRWAGTVASTISRMNSFNSMRDSRTIIPCIPNAGWHLSWLGGKEAQQKKLAATPHSEIVTKVTDLINRDALYNEGWHVDGKRLIGVDVDSTWPKWIVNKKCPKNWFRPR